MTMRSFVLICIISMLTAGIAFGADQPVVSPSITEPVLIAQQPETSADSTPAADEASTAVQPEQPILEPENRKPAHIFGLAVGSYSPLNSEVKDVFGGTKVRVGLRPILTETPERMRFMYDVSFYSLQKGDNQAVLIPLTVGMLQGFGQGTKLQSYAAINAGMFYGNVDAPSVGASEQGWGFTANATAGLIYNKRLQIELRYEIMDQFAGFEFDSFSLMAGYKMLQWRF